MRLAHALIIFAGLAASASALPLAGGRAQPAAGDPPAVTIPAQPEAPKGIPVPDMPIIKKTELDGGLIIEDMKIGDGPEVKPGGAVVAHYHGTLKSNGHVFDSSFDRGGEPLAYPLSGLMQGWGQGIPGMKVGGIRRLTVPAALAYGDQGNDDIPANSDLVFVIELLDTLQIEEIKEGSGQAATDPCVAVTTHIFKDKDGKEIEKSESSNPYIWFPGEIMGIEAGLDGMKVGGKRRLIIPKELNAPMPQMRQMVTPRTMNVPVTVEIELVGVRNLPDPRRR